MPTEGKPMSPGRDIPAAHVTDAVLARSTMDRLTSTAPPGPRGHRLPARHLPRSCRGRRSESEAGVRWTLSGGPVLVATRGRITLASDTRSPVRPRRRFMSLDTAGGRRSLDMQLRCERRPRVPESFRVMSSTAVLSRTLRRVALSVMVVAGLIAMHGLASTGGVPTCFGDPRLPTSGVSATDSPTATAVGSPSMQRADPAPPHPHSLAEHTAPETAADSMGVACVATIPRLVGVSNPLLSGFVALVALCLAVACSNARRFGRWRRRRPRPGSGMEILHLKCVLRT